MNEAEWISIERACDRLPCKAGVYIIRWCKNGRPVKIGRLKGEDDKGILYIGSTNNLKERDKALLKSLKNECKRKKHTMAKSYIFFSLKEVIKIDEMEITWIELDNRNEAEMQEWLALNHYGKKFGELPPLNLQALRGKYGVYCLAEYGKSRFAGELNQKLKDIIN